MMMGHGLGSGTKEQGNYLLTRPNAQKIQGNKVAYLDLQPAAKPCSRETGHQHVSLLRTRESSPELL